MRWAHKVVEHHTEAINNYTYLSLSIMNNTYSKLINDIFSTVWFHVYGVQKQANLIYWYKCQIKWLPWGRRMLTGKRNKRNFWDAEIFFVLIWVVVVDAFKNSLNSTGMICAYTNVLCMSYISLNKWVRVIVHGRIKGYLE